MDLSSDLISRFVKATKDTTPQKSETTVYGTIVEEGGKVYAKLDGSDQLTPVITTAKFEAGERVTVMIKDHTATVTGNLTSPSARDSDVEDMGTELGNKIDEFENIVADRVSTEQLTAEIAAINRLIVDGDATIRGELDAYKANIDELVADKATIEDLEAIEANITRLQTEKLDAEMADIRYANIDSLDALEIDVHNLEATYGDFVQATVGRLDATEASIRDLDAEKASIEDLDAQYANIDFSNIGEAAIRQIFSDSGLIRDLVVGDGTITGELVGVTIKGDLIEGNTIKADRLIVKGEDGIYYQLNVAAGVTSSEELSEEELQNGLSGSAIIARTITAEKISVDDLVAFDATIGGFVITDNSIYSGVKESVDNSTRGIYMDRDGQVCFGDANNHIKYYRDTDGTYKLAIVLSSGRTIEESIEDRIGNLRVGARNLIRNSLDFSYDTYGFRDVSGESMLGTARLGFFTLGGVGATRDAGTYALARSVDAAASSTEEYTPQGFVDGMKLHDYHLIAMENAIVKALTGVAASRITTITLPASGWIGSGIIYSQEVYVADATANSKIDLLPSPQQLRDLLMEEISLTAANSDGSITVFAIGDAPSMTLELQVMITEVIFPEVSV